MRPWLFLIVVVMFGVMSCAKNSHVTAMSPAETPAEISIEGASGSLAVLGESLLTVELATLTATTELLPQRSMSANDDLYVLDIARFIRPDTFSVRHVELDGDELAITWRVTHPFAEPTDPEGVPSATNRADLGFTGMVLFRTEESILEGHTFFTDVVLNPDLMTNADAFYRPAGLISGLSSFANTFPYQAIIDETGEHGSRVGVSNGGVVTGKFGTNGWTRTELGASNTGWTGYGVLHQGQASERVARFSIPHFTSPGRLSLKVNLIAKYNDPRGGTTPAEKLAHRLPFKPADPLRFGYRMPHGALDVERIVALPESGSFRANTISASTLRFHVTDWDARATESSQADLAAEVDPRHVRQGESQPPQFALCIPGVLGSSSTVLEWGPETLTDDDSAVGGDSQQDSGRVDDPLYFTAAVEKVAGEGQIPGLHKGLVRTIDPESAAFIAELDSETLMPLAVDQPLNATYQLFDVPLLPAGYGWGKHFPGIDGEITGIATDSAGMIYLGGWFITQIDLGGGVQTRPGDKKSGFLCKLGPDGSFVWQRIFSGTNHMPVNGMALSAAGEIGITGQILAPCEFDPGFILSHVPGSGFVAKYSVNNVFAWATSYPDSWDGRDVDFDVAGDVLATGTSGISLTDAWVGRWTPEGIFAWGTEWVDAQPNGGESIATDAAGDFYVGGYADGLDLGSGPIGTGLGQDAVLVKYTQDDEIAWHRWWGGGSRLDTIAELAVDHRDDSIVAGGSILGTVYFGSEPVYSAGDRDGFVVKYSSSGAYQWHYSVAADGDEQVVCLDIGPEGDMVVGGTFDRPIDFGGGLRPNGIQPPDYDSLSSTFVLSLTADGHWLWDSQIHGANDAQIRSSSVEAGMHGWVLSGGFFSRTIDLDPGLEMQWVTVPINYDPAYLLRLQASTGLF